MAYPPSRVRRVPGQAPIVPEIAQAYQNDPRTQLARAAIETGINGAPLAQGGYAWADGLARVMSGAMGGWQDRRMRDQYGRQDEETTAELAEVSRRREALKASTPKAATPPVEAIAAALGAPAAAPVAPVAPVVAGVPPPPPPRMGPDTGAVPRPQRGVAFTDPLAGTGRATSAFGDARPNGRTHNGRDLAAPTGTPIGAASDGTVIRAWNDTANGGGNSVRIRHADGSITGYAHMEGFNVRTGDTVRGGQPIGTVGSTGRSSGPHLHFTYRDPNGRRVDPATLQYGQPQQGEPEAAAPQAALDELPDVEVPRYNDYGMPAEQMPTAPAPVGATRSRGLQAADEMAAGGNPYLVNRAQAQIVAGLDQQTELDEADAARRNRMNEIGYTAGLDRYGQDRRDIRQNRHGTEERRGAQDYGNEQRLGSEAFTARQNELGYAHQTRERLGSQGFMAGESRLERDARQQEFQAQQVARAQERRERFMQSPTYLRADEASSAVIQLNSDALESVRQFRALNAEQRTGGFVERFADGTPIAAMGNGRLQSMESLANGLTLRMSQQLKGALSDKDIEFLKRANLSIGNDRSANDPLANMMEAALVRGNEYQVERMEALRNRDTNFQRDWMQYREQIRLVDENRQFVPGQPSFREWREQPGNTAARPSASFDRFGREIRQ